MSTRLARRVGGSLLLALVVLLVAATAALAALPGGSLDPTTVPKYQTPLAIPGSMPATSSSASQDYYEIAVRQFQQQILPSGLPMTTVWSYASVQNSGTLHYPANTIEAKVDKPVRVKWINDLKDKKGNYLPHLLPVDQTLHWANPPGGKKGRDGQGTDPTPYTGPVPIVTHLHGAHVTPESDGYPTAWYLPAAKNIPGKYATQGSNFGQIAGVAAEAGAATFQYPNDQAATTLWFHDHTLGMTRANVYAGPAGFYLLRGGAYDLPAGQLPSGKYEVPLVIQDRSFNADGSLFYPDNRAFFEVLNVAGTAGTGDEQFPGEGELQIPFIPAPVAYASGGLFGDSDISPMWNPEFFGNTMVVNGNTWPYQTVEARRYRFRLLNGSNSRFVILRLTPGAYNPNKQAAMQMWQIGGDQGFLAEPLAVRELLLGPAERADIIIDFANFAPGTKLTLINVGPDEPFGGGVPGVDFDVSDPATTGQVMEFRVVKRSGKDSTAAPATLALPQAPALGDATNSRELSLNELMSETVRVPFDPVEDAWVLDEYGNLVLAESADDEDADWFGPQQAKLGIVDAVTGEGIGLEFMDAVTETPGLNSTEVWEIKNFTADAHPIHIHQVAFEIVNREVWDPEVGEPGTVRGPEPWESGFKDTVIAYPGEITRVKARFDIAGLFVWHCHILEHEDNEMMRPFSVQ